MPEPERRRLESRVRRRKRKLERVNPVEEPERYRRALTDLVELEARLRLGGEERTP